MPFDANWLRFSAHGGQFHPCPESSVQDFERLLGVALPADYRWLLLTYGQGWLDGAFEIALGDGTKAMVDHIGDDIRQADVYLDDGFAPGLVPCGSDLLGDMFFLQVLDKQPPTVWWWCCYQNRDPLTELVRVADSFTSFLSEIATRHDE